MVAVNNRTQFSQVPPADNTFVTSSVSGNTSSFNVRQLTQDELLQALLDAELVAEEQATVIRGLIGASGDLSIPDLLVQKGILSRETVDFFIHQFPILKSAPNSANLGLVMRSANLITARQEAEVLRYQRMNPRLRFGEIAVNFGYCKQGTVDFFLQSLYPAGRTLPRVPHSSIGNRAKRVLDITGALVGLTVTGLIYIPLAIVIRIDSPGPVMYSQIRLGLRGKPFRLWKFRSMIQGADVKQHLLKSETSGQFFKQKNDPRVTRVGSFIRKTSLDEFPQFWNVLMGDMSLVGTRPPTPNEAMEYEDWHWKRLNVKPGITGEWQVNGRSAITEFDDVVKLDIRYQKRWSIRHDLNLIIQTVAAIFTRKGAC
ncbi:MAG: sugar transferase [Synechococcus sp.]